MTKEVIRILDLHRILFEQESPYFLFEVLLRTLLTYFIRLVIVRCLGKRMSGQLSILEMAVMSHLMRYCIGRNADP